MCSRVTLAMLGVLVCIQVPARAQTIEEHRARLREQVRALEAHHHEAMEAYREYRVAEGAVLSDTIRVGALVLITAPRYRVLVEEAAQAVWPRLRHALGPDTTLLAARSFVAVGPSRAMASTETLTAFSFSDSADVVTVAHILLANVERSLWGLLQTSQRSWFTSGWLDSVSFPDLRSLYVELVTAPAPAGRDCFMGSIEGCGQYLGLPGPYNPYVRWYSVDQRLDLAQRTASRVRRLERDRWDPAFEACVTRDEATCMRFLETLEPQPGTGPASRLARQTLQRLALAEGGAGGLGRMLTAADTSVRKRLEAASGLPIDSLIELWRDTVIERPVERPPVRRATGWIAVLWVAVLAVVAGRSSRWNRV